MSDVTVVNLFENMVNNTDLSYTDIDIGNFMDDFYNSEISDIYDIIKDEPNNALKTREIDRVFIAGFIEYYCNRLNILKPEWLYKDIYKCKKNTWFNSYGSNRGCYILVMVNTPKEFFNRNLFLEEVELSRL